MGKKVKKFTKKLVPEVAIWDEGRKSVKKGASSMTPDDPKMPGAPDAIAPGTDRENENVRQASENERRRLGSTGGRQGTSLLDIDAENEKEQSEYFG